MENETETDAKDTKVENPDGKGEDGKQSYDKAQQAIDQEKANAKRARTERDQLAAEKAELETHLITLSEELDTAKSESKSIKDELAEIKAEIRQAKSNGPDGGADDLDNAITDPVVTKHIKKLQAEKSELENQLKSQAGRIGELEKVKKTIEEERVQQTEAQKKANRQETILKKFDTKYGAKYRAEAIALANQKVEEAGKAPDGEFEIGELLHECYQEIKSKDSKPEGKKSVKVDTGTGTVSSSKSELSEGKIEDIWSDVKNKYKSKT